MCFFRKQAGDFLFVFCIFQLVVNVLAKYSPNGGGKGHKYKHSHYTEHSAADGNGGKHPNCRESDRGANHLWVNQIALSNRMGPLWMKVGFMHPVEGLYRRKKPAPLSKREFSSREPLDCISAISFLGS